MTDQRAVSGPGRNHLELMLLNARAWDLTEDEFRSSCRSRGLPEELAAELVRLLDFTHVCGFRLIYLGKIIARQLSEFWDDNPNEAGIDAAGALIWSIEDALPFVREQLLTVCRTLQSHGRGKSACASSRPDLMHAARQHLAPFIAIMRENEAFFPDLPDLDGGGQAPQSFASEQRSYAVGSFADESDNPFALDEATSISERTRAAVKYLIKIACADSSFEKSEKRFLVGAVEKLGERLESRHYRELAEEALNQSLEQILSGLQDQTPAFKEHLLFLGMLASAADGAVDASEKRILAESLPHLGIEKQRYASISQEALAALRSRHKGRA